MAGAISARFMAFLPESPHGAAIMHGRGRRHGHGAHSRDEIAMRPKRAVTITLAATVLQLAAHASGWAYCVAPADAQNRMYVSPPFPISEPGAAEPGFDTDLAARRLQHDTVECAQAGSEAAAVIMRQHAVDVNRQWGRQVIDVPWRPLR